MSDQNESPKSDHLNDRQRAFVSIYVRNRFNGTRAAIKAGYAPNSAAETASELLKKDKIKEAVKAEIKAFLDDVEPLKKLWVEEVKALAFSDIRDVQEFDEDGVRFKRSRDLKSRAARAIESVESTVTYDKQGNKVVTKKVKLHSKKGSLDTLGKYLGMLQDDPTAGVTIIINQNETDLV